ncbi:hypothetical protein ACIRSU_27920 [Streptomyces sp. NPDC101160]|uniref:hypothetical protein n=1 Tax=Streptomyces sp. NPDC101160 TaxID=3366118 RepID=UPI003813A11B
MTARTHTGVRPVRSLPGTVDTRLPWWTLALSAVAFVGLFLLIAAPGDAPGTAGDPEVGRILERIQQTLSL